MGNTEINRSELKAGLGTPGRNLCGVSCSGPPVFFCFHLYSGSCLPFMLLTICPSLSLDAKTLHFPLPVVKVGFPWSSWLALWLGRRKDFPFWEVPSVSLWEAHMVLTIHPLSSPFFLTVFFFFFMVRYTKCTIWAVFKVYNAVELSTFTVMCTHHHHFQNSSSPQTETLYH